MNFLLSKYVHKRFAKVLSIACQTLRQFKKIQMTRMTLVVCDSDKKMTSFGEHKLLLLLLPNEFTKCTFHDNNPFQGFSAWTKNVLYIQALKNFTIVYQSLILYVLYYVGNTNQRFQYKCISKQANKIYVNQSREITLQVAILFSVNAQHQTKSKEFFLQICKT